MLRIAICDDDVAFTAELEKEVLRESLRLGIRAEVNVYTDGKPLADRIRTGYRYELILIDIEMKQMNGIQAARYIREKDTTVLFIYISGYDQYLKELFEVEPFRFLSKPLNINKFHRYFSQACDRIGEMDEFYEYTFNKEIRKVKLKKIVYFESKNRVIYIFLNDGNREEFYGKLNDVEHHLIKSNLYFLRIHQSYLVNYDYIKSINFTNVVIRCPGDELALKISENRKKSVRKYLVAMAGGKKILNESKIL